MECVCAVGDSCDMSPASDVMYLNNLSRHKVNGIETEGAKSICEALTHPDALNHVTSIDFERTASIIHRFSLSAQNPHVFS